MRSLSYSLVPTAAPGTGGWLAIPWLGDYRARFTVDDWVRADTVLVVAYRRDAHRLGRTTP